MASLLKSPPRRPTWWPPFLSALIAPGLGQVANGEYGKGFLLLTTTFAAFGWVLKTVSEQLALVLPGTPDQWTQAPEQMRAAILKIVNENPDLFLTFHLLILLTWTFGVVDAYITARQRRAADMKDHEDTARTADGDRS